MRASGSFKRVVASAFAAFFVAALARAENCTWVGGDGDWNVAENWTKSSDGSHAVPTAADTAVFPAGGPHAVTLQGETPVAGLSFTGASPVTLSGEASLSVSAPSIFGSAVTTRFDRVTATVDVGTTPASGGVGGLLRVTGGADVTLTSTGQYVENYRPGQLVMIEEGSKLTVAKESWIAGTSASIVVDDSEFVAPKGIFLSYDSKNVTVELRGTNPCVNTLHLSPFWHTAGVRFVLPEKGAFEEIPVRCTSSTVPFGRSVSSSQTGTLLIDVVPSAPIFADEDGFRMIPLVSAPAGVDESIVKPGNLPNPDYEYLAVETDGETGDSVLYACLLARGTEVSTPRVEAPVGLDWRPAGASGQVEYGFRACVWPGGSSAWADVRAICTLADGTVTTVTVARVTSPGAVTGQLVVPIGQIALMRLEVTNADGLVALSEQLTIDLRYRQAAYEATGDDVQVFRDGEYDCVVFRADGTLTLSNAAPVDVLVIGGGGGGGVGTTCGGGGAGGFVECVFMPLAEDTYSVVVGAGGARATTETGRGLTGGNSSFAGVTAHGGGGGASYNNPAWASGDPGGSGGGGGKLAGAGRTGEGNAGGKAVNSGDYPCGGGGGAGGGGGDAAGQKAGSGGVGKASEITGKQVWYAGGGAGAAKAAENNGVGGMGGGGDVGVAGVDGTGGGGGARAAGGSGIVIVRLLRQKRKGFLVFLR